MPFKASRERSLLAALGPLLSSTFQVSQSNPALRILLRAFGLARDAIQGIARALSPRCARTVAKLDLPGLAKQPCPPPPATRVPSRARCHSRHRASALSSLRSDRC